jgi:hypothetical protein
MGVSGTLLLSVIVAQTVQAQSTSDPDLARIRRALAAEAPALSVPSLATQEGPVFRLTIFARKPEKPLWFRPSAVPAYIRPFAPSYHHEFLEQVTKNRERAEEFRAPTLYPIGVDVVEVVQFLAKHIKAANRKRQESNARDDVRKALEEFLACRANPDRPGC